MTTKFVYVYYMERRKGNVCLDVPQKTWDLFAVSFMHLSFIMKITLKCAHFNILGHLDINFRFVNPQNLP